MTKFRRKWINFFWQESKKVMTLDKFTDENILIEVEKKWQDKENMTRK